MASILCRPYCPGVIMRETLTPGGGEWSCRLKALLPEPPELEGLQVASRRGRARARSLFMILGTWDLLDILNLFADFFEFCFCADDMVGDLGVVCLGTDGVELAIELLAEEVERASYRGGGD